MKTIFSAAALFGVISLIHPAIPATAQSGQEAPPKTAVAEVVQSSALAVVSGTVVPYKEVTLSAQVPGQVTFIAGHEGDAIEANKLLVSISDDAIQARRRAAVAQYYAADAELRNAHVQYSREFYSPQSGKPTGMGMPSMMDQFMRPFSGQYAGPNDPWVRRYADLYGSAKNLDSARSRLLQAKAQIEQLDSQLRDARLHAPFNGVITKKFVEQGDTVQPGQRLLRVAHLAYLRIQAEVPVSLVSSLTPGEFVDAKIDVGGGIPVKARVSQIFPVADQDRHTVTVKFDLPRGLQGGPGMYAEVYIPNPSAKTSKVVKVPEDAILRRGSLPAVEVWENGRRSLRLVREGQRTGDGKATILSGLNGGENVILQKQ